MEKKGYCITTCRIRLFCEHPKWVKDTIVYYNEVLSFYYEYLLKNQNLLVLTNQKLLRELEIRTIGEKRIGKEAEYPFPFQKVPLYFRRSAINSSIRMMRSFHTQYEKWQQGISKTEPKPAKAFHVQPIFYKGMYKNLLEDSIELKLWNGEKWIWETCHFKKQMWGSEVEIQSPTIKINKQKIMLHVPVVSTVVDISTLEERIENQNKICAVSFPNKDNLAVIAVLNHLGKCVDSYFIKGEKELSHRRRHLIGKIEKCKINMKDESRSITDYPNYRKKITNLTEYYAHLVSRKVVNYCIAKNIKIIVVSKFKTIIDFNKLNYLNSTNYDWIGRRIIQYIKYKAFKEGIIVAGVNPIHTADCCHICGSVIYKFNEGYCASKNFYGGKRYKCKNGHQGNTALNTAINVGHVFLKQKVNPVSKGAGETNFPQRG